MMIMRFFFISGNHLFHWGMMGVACVLCTAAWAQPAEVAVARPDILLTEEFTKEVTFIGGWNHVNGDADMSTSVGDEVPVRCSTNIYIEGEKVILKIFFHIEEYGGDHTIYSGSRQEVIYRNTNPAYSLMTVEINGSRLNAFQTTSIGERHGFHDFPISRSYWDRLQYCIDAAGHQDDESIGVKGNLRLNIILQKLPGTASVRTIAQP